MLWLEEEYLEGLVLEQISLVPTARYLVEVVFTDMSKLQGVGAGYNSLCARF